MRCDYCRNEADTLVSVLVKPRSQYQIDYNKRAWCLKCFVGWVEADDE